MKGRASRRLSPDWSQRQITDRIENAKALRLAKPAKSDVDHQIDREQKAAALARQYLRMRRLRTHMIGANCFADPSWDMLLDLFVQETQGTKVSVSSACLASGVATTTALGHLLKLEERGLLVRAADPHDRRRTYVELSASAHAAVGRWILEAFDPDAKRI